MTPTPDALNPIARRLGRIRSTFRGLFLLDGASRTLLTLGAAVVVTFLIDWRLHLPAGVRLFFLVATFAVAGWVAVRRLIYPLGVRVSDDDLAILVERRHPELNDRLISAIQLSRDMDAPRGEVSNSPELVKALIADAEKATEGVDFQAVVVRRHVARPAWAAAALLFLLSLGVAAVPEMASIYLNRMVGGSLKWPRRTRLAVLDFPNHRRVIARGDDLPVAVEFQGVDPGKVVLDYEFATGESGRERFNPLLVSQKGRETKLYQFTFTRVTGPFTFTVRGGDDVTETHSVETLNPPGLENVRVFYQYPPYMKKADTPSDRPEIGGNVVAPFHTKVRFEAETNEEIESALFSLGLKAKEKSQPLEVTRAADGRPRRVSGAFEVAETYSEYGISVTAANGLANRDPIRFTVKGLEDRAPDIFVRDPLGDEFVTEVCERPLEIEVKDDYGVSRIVLETQVLSQQKEKSKEWTPLEFTREQNSRDYGEVLLRSRHVLNLGPLGLQPGDHVEIRFRAEDYKDVGPRNVKLSKVYKLSIVTLGTLEKDLQDAIEKIKLLLKAQKSRQETAWNRTGRLITTYGRTDALSLEQKGEIRQAGLEQNDLTAKLDGARKDIRQIQRRGVYNKIFNESAAAQLQGAIDELDLLTGEAGDPTKPGLSRVAASAIEQSSRATSGADRTRLLKEGQNGQSITATGIQKALDYLDKWSSYQEVIRVARDLHERQKRATEEMKKRGTK